MYTLSPVYFVC